MYQYRNNLKAALDARYANGIPPRKDRMTPEDAKAERSKRAKTIAYRYHLRRHFAGNAELYALYKLTQALKDHINENDK